MGEEKIIATVIGSMPHKDAKRACELIFENFPVAPAWPQLPKRSFYEGMCQQISEGLPAVVLNETNNKMYFKLQDGIEKELEKFYERYLSDNPKKFAISQVYAEGFYAFLEIAKKTKPKYLKGQLIGPISFGLTITDENRRAILYNEQLADVIVKNCAMKACWQIKEFLKISPKTIIFIDEPYLSSYGSAFMAVSRENIIKFLNEVIDVIKLEGALTGIHCCGNTDWSLLTDTKVDIISFDAYEYSEKLALYSDAIEAFIKRGGKIAWGIVPSSEKINNENVETLVKKLEDGFKFLIEKGIDKKRLTDNFFITPSCGVGSLTEEIAEKIIIATHNVAVKMG